MLNGTINFLTAWATVVLIFLVSVIWILRLLIKFDVIKKDSGLAKVNRALRVHHKSLGITLIITSLIHGVVSSAKLIDVNLGSITFFLIVILGISYLVKSKTKRNLWLNVHRLLTVATIIVLILHLTDVGIQGVNLITSSPPDIEEYNLSQDEVDEIIDDIEDESSDTAEATQAPLESESNSQDVQYADGVYTGTADGFGPDLTVEVTVADGLISEITVISHNEREERYYGVPMEVIPEQIIETQSLDVDTVSGATYTSIGLKNAVIDALSEAIISGELPEQEEASSGGHRHGH